MTYNIPTSSKCLYFPKTVCPLVSQMKMSLLWEMSSLTRFKSQICPHTYRNETQTHIHFSASLTPTPFDSSKRFMITNIIKWIWLNLCFNFSPPPPSLSIPLSLFLLCLSLSLVSSSSFHLCSGKLTDTASSSSSSRSESPQLLSPKEGVTAYTHAPPYTMHTSSHAFR